MILRWSQSATLKQSPCLSMSSKEQVPSQCQILFLDPLQILLSNNFFSLLNYFVTSHIITCQVFVALCAEDLAAPVAPIWVHTVFGTVPLDFLEMRCVRHWCLREVHPPMSPKRLKKKKSKLSLLFSTKFKHQGQFYTKLFLRYFKA